MPSLGPLALWLALLVGVWGAWAGFVGGLKDRPDLARSARNAVFAMCGALLVAVASLEWALFQHDFNVEYVAAYTSRNLPIFYTWSALYAGQKGSLLFWATVLSAFGSLALVLTPRRHRELLPYVAGVVSVVAAFCAVGVGLAGVGATPGAPSRAPPLRGGRGVGRRGLLYLRHAVGPGEPVRATAVPPARRGRPQSAAPDPGDGVPPADAVPR